MSYRAFKRLLGETSLERKCRFLFGAGILVLITLSFWFYAYLTEHLAYDQATATCRLLTAPLLAQKHNDFFEGQRIDVESVIPREKGKEDYYFYKYLILHVNQTNLDP